MVIPSGMRKEEKKLGPGRCAKTLCYVMRRALDVRPGGARPGSVKWATGSGWGVDMTASARFSMASRLMRDATNLAGSQDCSAQLRRQDITQLHVLLTLDHFAYRRLQRCSICPVSILVIACSRPPTLRILRRRSGPPRQTNSRLSPVLRTTASCTHCDLAPRARLPNPRRAFETRADISNNISDFLCT